MTKPLRFRYERTKYGSHPKCVPAPCGLYRPLRRQIFLPASRTSCARHRADARRPAPPGGRRRTEEQPFPLPSPAIGPVRHRPPCPVCPLRLRRQTASRQNNPASAVAFAIGLYYLYRRQTAPRQNNPASAVAFALGLYYLYRRQTAPRQTTSQARLLLPSVCTIFAGTKLPHHAFCRLFRR